jgi:hypothetical protein
MPANDERAQRWNALSGQFDRIECRCSGIAALRRIDVRASSLESPDGRGNGTRRRNSTAAGATCWMSATPESNELVLGDAEPAPETEAALGPRRGGGKLETNLEPLTVPAPHEASSRP